MFNIKKYNFTSGYAAFLAGISLSFFSSGALACDSGGYIDFHNKSTVPFKIVIKTLPGSVVNCEIRDDNGLLQHKGCEDYKLRYQEYTIDMPAKKGDRLGKHDGVCMSNSGRYMVSYRTLIDEGKQLSVEGPAATVIERRHNNTTSIILEHSGDHSYITSSGCLDDSDLISCTINFYKTL